LVAAVGMTVSERKESGRFLKKAAQKFLLLWAKGVVADNALGPDSKSFFASFCSQKEAFLSPH
jgi:hypothetical protein